MASLGELHYEIQCRIVDYCPVSREAGWNGIAVACPSLNVAWRRHALRISRPWLMNLIREARLQGNDLLLSLLDYADSFG